MKAVAVTNVIAWGAFWVFGAVALFAELGQGRVLTAAVLAGIGFLVGMACHLGLCNRIAPTQRVAPQSEG